MSPLRGIGDLEMNTVIKDVVSDGKIVGQAEVVTFENIDEALSSLSEEICLKYINRSHTVVLMDNARRVATGGGATGVRAIMASVKNDPEKLAKVKALLGL